MTEGVEPFDLIAEFLAARGEMGPELNAWIKAQLKQDRSDLLAQALPRLIVPDLDYTTATSLHRTLSQLRGKGALSERTIKIAVLGGVTTQQLTALLDLFLAAGQVRAEMYHADFGTLRQEVLDPASELYRFQPDFLLLPTTWRDAGHRPLISDSRDEVDRKVGQEVAEWNALWRTAHERLRCQIIQCNFAAPAWRALANMDGKHPAGLGRYLASLNHAFSDAAPAYVTIHDADHLAATWGRDRWHDERFYHQAKLPCAPECLVDYAHSLASIVLAQLGKGRKCLVLDLDHTLWGGVIGDDGLGGIRLGQGDPEGEAFLAFQLYVKSLQERGVILAVCSKNTEAIAKEVFEKHTEMVLRLGDISCFMANWDDKATNLRRIANQLNIGADSLVFVDDNPAERAIVRQLCPEVAVPELPEDPAQYIRALDRQRYFQVVAISGEDLKRTDFYQASGARQALESTAEDLNSFLKSLDLVATVAPVDAMNLERSAQLIQRSNQFNVTTRRHAAGDLMAMVADTSFITRTVSLRDRFGDHGLISVVLAQVVDDSLRIDTWLMSCRVLKRGVEDFVLNDLVRSARARGVRTLVGDYLPTQKNGLVRDLYATLGFALESEDASGNTRWTLPIADNWAPRETFIQEKAKDGTGTR